jgi:hypothetical protein
VATERRAGVRVDAEHGAGRGHEDLLRVGAHEELADQRAPAQADDYQLRAGLLGHGDDVLAGIVAPLREGGVGSPGGPRGGEASRLVLDPHPVEVLLDDGELLREGGVLVLRELAVRRVRTHDDELDAP